MKENASMRETIERLQAQLQESRDETAALQNANEKLARDFKHELSSKRLALLGASKRRHQEYLEIGLARERAHITELFSHMHSAMNAMAEELRKLDTEEREPLYAELTALRERVREKSVQAQARKKGAWDDAGSYHAGEIDKLGASPVEDAALSAVRRYFAWETFLGLKIISAAGALLLLLGVFTFGRFLYTNMGPALQWAVIFIFGMALMAAGEAFYRKKWRGGFALALTAGGSGILFLSAALGHMTLGVLPMWAALAICACVSLLAFAASLRYDAQLVAVFALLGGYLPAIALTRPIAVFAAIYFSVLCLLALSIATRKSWRTARSIGLGAALIAALAVMEVSRGSGSGLGTAAVVGASIAISFLSYIIIPVFGAWFTKTRIKAADVALLTCNVFFHFLLGLYWGNEYAPSIISLWGEHTETISALVAAFFAVCCIVMALSVERRKHSGVPQSETGSLRALFFITSVTFTALVVLFALDSVWLSVGWLVQSVGLSLYGIFKNRRRFRVSGLVIGCLCLFVFLFVDVTNYRDPLFVWQYLSVTLAAAVVSTAALIRKPERPYIGVWLDVFRGAAVFNLWVFMVYALHDPLMPSLVRIFGGSAEVFATLLSIALGFALAFFVPRIRLAYNYGFRYAAIAIGIVSTVALILYNAGAQGLYSVGTDASGAALASAIAAGILSITAFALYIAVNIVAVMWLNDLLRFLSGARRFPVELQPLIVSAFAMLLAAQNLVVQLSLRASSLTLTLLFALTALCWVVFGFVKRNSVTRISGLSMAIFSVVKLFVLDLHGLETTLRIVSYFTGGIVLLAISFIYQWFSKRLKLSDK